MKAPPGSPRFLIAARCLLGLGAATAVLSTAPLSGANSLEVQEGPGRAPVLLISIDGLRPDYVLQADRHRLRIPNLRRFVSAGAYATGMRGVIPTVTYPSHATLLTGVSPARHGVYANTTWDPLDQNQTGWYWYAEDIRVPTLWDAASAAGLVTASVHWPVSVGANVTHNLVQYWRTGTPDDRKLLRALSTRGLVAAMERELGPYADGIDETIEGDENRARFAARLMDTRRPHFMTAYFTALDHEQHATGPFSPSAFAVLERIDAIVGDLVRAAERATGGEAVVCVVSDHGFIRTDREVHLLTAFRDAGLLTFPPAGGEKPGSGKAEPKPTAWVATAWSGAASAAIVIHDSADASERAKVDALVRRLAADSLSGIERVLAAPALAGRGFPDATYYLNLKPGYKIGYKSTGPLVTTVTVGGMHGYLPEYPDMNASFFITGPGVPAGRSLGEVDMRDVAPTIAARLGVALPEAEGKNLLP